MFPGTRVNSLRSRIDVPRPRRSVAVDNQSGIVLLNDDGIERFSDQAANRADADVPGNVTLAFGIGKAELSKPPRKMLPRVIGHDEKRRCAVFVVYRERRRLVSRQKTIRRLIHLRPASLKRVVIDADPVLGAKNACYP